MLRAWEQSIDLANHVIKAHKLGIPTTSAESYELQQQHEVIEHDLLPTRRKTVHFRNLITHQCQRMDLEVIQSVIVSGLDDLVQFGDRVMAFV